jgi:uncharacterized protein involved in exopolysaccharide biosynthesis
LAQERSAKEAELNRNIASVRAQLVSRESQFQQELLQAQQSVRSEIERVKLRADAEVADLKASINRLEVDLMKVGRINFATYGARIANSGHAG